MKRPSNEEIDELALKYQKLEKKAESGKAEDIKEYKVFQNHLINKLKPLVLSKVAKYRKFSNYPDLEQEGYEAMLMSLGTYKPGRAPFSYWAKWYIETRISRAANAHSTIRIPIKKAREIKPYKTNTIPVMLDTSKDPLESFEDSEDTSHLMSAIDKLPEEQQEIVNLTYGLNGARSNTAGKVMEQLSITRSEYTKLLSQAKQTLKKELGELD